MKPSPPYHVFLFPIYIHANSKLNSVMRRLKKSLTSIYTNNLEINYLPQITCSIDYWFCQLIVLFSLN